MNIREMHIAVDVLLQKVNSNSRRNLLPEEKDLILNWQIREFVSDKIKHSRVDNESGFYNDEVDAAAISTLLVQYKQLYTSIDVAGATFKCLLPSDFRNYVSFSGIVAPRNCMSEAEKATPHTINRTHYLYTLKITEGMGGMNDKGEYYTNLGINYNGKGMVMSMPGTGDISFTRYVFLAFQKLLNNNELFLTELSWETNPGDMRRQATIIWKEQELLTSTVSLTLGAVSVYATVKKVDTEVVDRNKQFLNTNVSPARRIKPQFLFRVEAFPFSKSNFNKLNLSLDNDAIYIPNGGSYLLTTGVLNYIKKPAEVNLSLGIDCDLPDSNDVHERICSKAVEELLLVIEAPNWQQRFETNKLK